MSEDKILTVDLFFDQAMDISFQTMIENKMKSFDLVGITKAVTGQVVGSDSKLENKEIESNFVRYIRHTLGDIESGIANIIIKFPERFKMEIYLS